MPDREKVIKALTCCIYGTEGMHCDGCPYRLEKYGTCDTIDDMNKDALALLTPRILDLDELQFHPHVWYEISNGTNPIPALVVPPRTVTRQRIVAYQPVFDAVVYLPENDCYKRTWRCWSAEPTEKQRKAAKWNED